MVLRDECGGTTGVVLLQEDGTLSFIDYVEESLRFQFTDGNSLQDIVTNMCVVPFDNESPEPQLTVLENQCGRPESAFVFQSKYKGYGDRIFAFEGIRCYFLMLKSHFFAMKKKESIDRLERKEEQGKKKLRKMNC